MLPKRGLLAADRSTSVFIRARALSARNRSTSSSVGGSPVRSSETRRMRVRPIRGRRGTQAFLLQPREDEPVNRIPRPLSMADRRQRRTDGFDISPMRGIGRSLRNPVAQRLNLRRRKGLARFDRRHAIVGVLGGDRGRSFRSFPARRARWPDSPDLAGFKRLRAEIEPELRLAFPLVGSVAFVAVLAEDGPDIAVEINGSGLRRRRGREQGKRRRQQDRRGTAAAPAATCCQSAGVGSRNSHKEI